MSQLRSGSRQSWTPGEQRAAHQWLGQRGGGSGDRVAESPILPGDFVRAADEVDRATAASARYSVRAGRGCGGPVNSDVKLKS
jgi:hypothetical protein